MRAIEELIDELVDVYDDGRTTAPLLDRVRELLEPGSRPSREGAPPGKRPAAPLPVESGPFDLLTDVHSGIRDVERTLRKRGGFGPIPRGRGDRGTRDALRALPALLVQIPPDSPLAADAYLRVVRWHRQARILTGHRDVWARLARHSCPYCGAESVRVRPDGVLVCLTPSCTDPAGERPSWVLSDLAAEGVEA